MQTPPLRHAFLDLHDEDDDEDDDDDDDDDGDDDDDDDDIGFFLPVFQS